jgi:hypothetical protein
MGHLSSMFNGLARSFSLKKGRNSVRCERREAVEAMAKEAKKNDLILCSSGTINVDGSNNFASVFSKRGQKGTNQDCCMVWEVCTKIKYYNQKAFFVIVLRACFEFRGF